MAEGPSGKKVYLTRSRKRSMDKVEHSTEELEKEESGALDSAVESLPTVIDLTEVDECDTKTLECAICLQNCVHPARLPCGHIFCFLCVKGAANGNKKCAMCRSPIPRNYFNNPELLVTPEEIADDNYEGYKWFYEGRQGWWQYDPRASEELENAWVTGVSNCELLIAGYIYTIDVKEMYQMRKGQPNRKRKIKRDLANCEKLGVAGLRDPHAPPSTFSEEDKSSQDDVNEYDYDDDDDDDDDDGDHYYPTYVQERRITRITRGYNYRLTTQFDSLSFYYSDEEHNYN